MPLMPKGATEQPIKGKKTNLQLTRGPGEGANGGALEVTEQESKHNGSTQTNQKVPGCSGEAVQKRKGAGGKTSPCGTQRGESQKHSGGFRKVSVGGNKKDAFWHAGEQGVTSKQTTTQGIGVCTGKVRDEVQEIQGGRTALQEGGAEDRSLGRKTRTFRGKRGAGGLYSVGVPTMT